MASETVVSHNVMVSGLFPKHMGWSDEAFRDSSNVLGYGASAHRHVTGDLGYADYVKLIADGRLPQARRLPARQVPGHVVANVGEKGYQVESMAAGSSDFWRAHGQQDEDGGRSLSSSSRAVGRHVPRPRPATASRPTSRRPALHGQRRHNADVAQTTTARDDAPAWLYPEDGRYMVPGIDPAPPERRRLGRRRGHQDHARTRTGRACSSPSAPSTRSATCGAAARSTRSANYGWDPDSIYDSGPHAVRRQERRRPARPAHRQAQGPAASSTTPSSS